MPLFHSRILKKALNQSAKKLPDAHKAILDEWRIKIETGQIFKQQETSLHHHFIQQILIEILGYQGVSPDKTYNLYQECPIAKGKWRIDIALGYFSAEQNQVIAPFELKGAKTQNLDAIMSGQHKSPVQQAWEYAMDTHGAKWVLLSNYSEIRLYAIGYGQQRYEHWELAKLAEPIEYARFILLLSQDNLLGNHTKQLLKDGTQIEKEITEQLYQDYKTLRYTLIQTLTTDNPYLAKLDAIGFAQTILDRILFIAFAEDSGLLPKGSLKSRTNWANLKVLFHAIDQGNPHLNIPPYNGGLFKENARLDALIVNAHLCQAFKKIGEYDFKNEISVTVLGQLFEQSISDLERLHAQAQGSVLEKIDQRKREGLVYTQDKMTRFIVEETLGRYLTEQFDQLWAEHQGHWKTQKDEIAAIGFWRDYQTILKTVKVLDPACGAGAFLVAAFDYLYAEYTRINDKLETLTGTYEFFDLAQEILNHNLYGVDVNPESIEMTRLSLWLKTAKRGHVLNSLEQNLHVGDSLIEDSKISSRAFAWEKAFPDIFAAGGFDVVLGNPPYVRQELISHFKPYLRHQYQIFHGVADLYSYFFERGLGLLKPQGKLGYICSSTFFKTGCGKNLRRLLADRATINSAIDFGDLQIFKRVTTYPTILVMENQPPTSSHDLHFLKLDVLPEEGLSKTFHLHKASMPQARLNEESWRLEDERLAQLREKIVAAKPTLKEVYGSPSRGVLTGLNKAFVIDRATRDQLIATDANSAELIKPFLEGKDLKKWRAEPRDRYLILISKGWTRKKAGLDLIEETLAWEWLKRHYPAIAEWLAPFENQAKKRTDKGEFWWELRACAYYDEFEKPKIIYPVISQGAKFLVDNTKSFTNDKIFILPIRDNYLLGLLNSNLFWFHLLGQCSALRGGNWRLILQAIYINQIPIPVEKPTDSQKTEIASLAEQCQQSAELRYQKQAAIHRRIADLCPAKRTPKFNTKLKNGWTLAFEDFRKEVKKCFRADIPQAKRNEWETLLSAEKAAIEQLNQQIIQLEQQLNQKVYALFGLTEAEIKLVEANI